MVVLRDWGDRYLADPGGPPVRTVHADGEAQVHAVLRCETGHDITTMRQVQPRPGPGAVRLGPAGDTATFDADLGRLSAAFAWEVMLRVFGQLPAAARYGIGGLGAMVTRMQAHACQLGVVIEALAASRGALRPTRPAAPHDPTDPAASPQRP